MSQVSCNSSHAPGNTPNAAFLASLRSDAGTTPRSPRRSQLTGRIVAPQSSAPSDPTPPRPVLVIRYNAG